MTGVTRWFGSTVALDGVQFSLAAGEVHALLGENGAGKTTLMRILAGLDRPDEGSVILYGEPVTRFRSRELRDRGVAMVQQHFTLVPTLTAGENLALARPDGQLRPSERRLRSRVARLAEGTGWRFRSIARSGSSRSVSGSAWRSCARWTPRLGCSSWTSRPRC